MADAFIKQDCLTVIIFSRAVKRTKNRTEYKSCSRQVRDIHYIPLLPPSLSSKVRKISFPPDHLSVSPDSVNIYERIFLDLYPIPGQASNMEEVHSVRLSSGLLGLETAYTVTEILNRQVWSVFFKLMEFFTTSNPSKESFIHFFPFPYIIEILGI